MTRIINILIQFVGHGMTFFIGVFLVYPVWTVGLIAVFILLFFRRRVISFYKRGREYYSNKNLLAAQRLLELTAGSNFFVFMFFLVFFILLVFSLRFWLSSPFKILIVVPALNFLYCVFRESGAPNRILKFLSPKINPNGFVLASTVVIGKSAEVENKYNFDAKYWAIFLVKETAILVWSVSSGYGMMWALYHLVLRQLGDVNDASATLFGLAHVSVISSMLFDSIWGRLTGFNGKGALHHIYPYSFKYEDSKVLRSRIISTNDANNEYWSSKIHKITFVLGLCVGVALSSYI